MAQHLGGIMSNADVPTMTGGVVPVANLGTGTPDSTKYLRGDGTWAAVTGGGTPASSVVSETGYGQAAAVGTGTDYARNDHTHGSPALGTTGTTACAGNDARLSDARTPTAHAASHQNGGADEISVAGLSGVLADAQTPAAHTHNASDINAGTIGTARLGSGTASASTYLRGDQTWATPSGGSGAPAVYINLINHFTTLENTTSANATWKIPAATTYGQVAALLDMTKLGNPSSATFYVVYTNTATSGTNQIGITLGSTPRAAGTTVTQVASSAVTMANSATYPQTIEKAITISELGTTKQWLQVCLNIATSTVGPNIMSAGVILYY